MLVMARHSRLDFPGFAQHIIQRGNDRQACFAADEDYQFYLRELREAARRFDCALHAYVLMTNHVHLLVSPSARRAVSQMMQALGRRYVGRFNARHGRTGTLWEGRFKAGLVDSDRYALTCYRYIELNPVRAGMVSDPARYRWSSHRHNALGELDSGITPHPSYVALGEGATGRDAYRRLFAEDIGADELDEIRLHTQQQRAWGTSRFQTQIEALAGRAASVRPRGRRRSGEVEGK
jgi:putative transposase